MERIKPSDKERVLQNEAYDPAVLIGANAELKCRIIQVLSAWDAKTSRIHSAVIPVNRVRTDGLIVADPEFQHSESAYFLQSPQHAQKISAVLIINTEGLIVELQVFERESQPIVVNICGYRKPTR